MRSRSRIALLPVALALAVSSPAQVRRAPSTAGPILEGPGWLKAGMFEHRFDPDQVKAVARNRGTGVSPAHYAAMKTTPPFVLATAYFLDTAARTYGTRLARLYPEAQRIRVRYPSRYGVPMQFQHGVDQIIVNLAPMGWDMDLHRQRTAHELFHAFQSRTVGGTKCTSEDGLWWIEATAEYAACDVVWPKLSARKGGGVGRAYPYLLDAPLAATGAPDDDHDTSSLDIDWSKGEELQYDKGFFVQHLVERQGAEFFAMNDAVLAAYKKDDRGPEAIFEPLNAFLVGRSSSKATLAEAYRGFAAFYLLSADSPVAADKIVKGKASFPATPLIAVAPSLGGRQNAADRLAADAPGKPADPLEYAFALREGYTAKGWAVEAEMPLVPATGAPLRARTIRVMAAALESDGTTSAQVFKAKRGAWIPGVPAPLFTLQKTGDSRTLDLGADETLYVVATCTAEGTGSRRAAVRVMSVPPAPPPAPRPPATPPTPARPPAGAGPSSSGGYWRFLRSRSLEFTPTPGSTNASASVSEGRISGTQTDVGPDGPATWAGGCSWTIQAPHGLDRLVPGDVVEVSMTATDRSVPEKTSGWNHGHVGVTGSLRFDRPDLPLGVTHGAAVDLVNVQATWQQANPTPSVTQKGSWTVPAGPGSAEWGGRAALAASCGFGRFERVYEWTTEPYVPRSGPAPAPPAAPARAALTGSWKGTWTNSVGEKGPDSLVIEEAPDGTLAGTWSGNLRVAGRRVDATTLELTGRTSSRAYDVQGTLADGVLTLRYVAKRLDGRGSYEGTSALRRE